MTELINVLIAAICGAIIGAIIHSAYLHTKKAKKEVEE